MVKQRLSLLAAALWWGSLGAVGFMVVPLLFAQLPTPALAGNMAARLFTAQTWLGVVCAMVILTGLRARMEDEGADLVQAELMLVLGGLLLALLQEFAVAPRIVARDNLALWHGVGSAMYLGQWVCAGLTLWRLGRRG